MEQLTEQDLDIEAAMLAEATELIGAGTHGDAARAGTQARTDLAVGAPGDAEDDYAEYDSAVDDTLEDDEESEFFEAMIAGDEVTGADLAEAAASEADLRAAMASGSAPLTPAPPAPGSPESTFRKCDCLG